MKSTAQQIENEIKNKRRGKIYFVADFVNFGTTETVKKTLLRLEESGFLIRLAHGIYLYPLIDKKLGLGIIYPTVDEIAKKIAKRDKARIVPTGVYALNALGLSTQIPTNIVYLTDGAPRKIKIYNQQITFKHVAPKNLAYKSSLLMLVVSALKEIGKDNITQEQIDKIKEVLLLEDINIILDDMQLAPAWIRKIIQQMI